MIPEFKTVGHLNLQSQPKVDAKFCLLNDLQDFPAGSRVLNFKQGQSQQQLRPNQSFDWKIGVFRKPDEFVEESKKLTHPFDSCRAVDDEVLNVLVSTLKDGPVAIMKHRLQILQQWKSWGLELSGEEDVLHRSMPEHRQKLMSGKKDSTHETHCRKFCLA